MAEEYTPTEGEVRADYARDRDGWPDQERREDFDRFMAEVRREAAEKAWDECVQALAWATDNGPDPLRYVAENSPYRKGQS